MGSATGRGAARQPLDHYATPAWATRAILRELTGLNGLPPATVLEPSCGAGSILDVLRSDWPSARLSAIEIDPERATAALDRGHPVRVGDFLNGELHACERWDLVIGNPPYSLASEFVRRAIDVGGQVAFLLRLGFLGSATRADLLRATRPDVFVLPRRPSFCVSCRCRSCGARWTLPAEASVEACGACGSADVAASRSDATEYAWFVWGVGRRGRWDVLDLGVPTGASSRAAEQDDRSTDEATDEGGVVE